MTKNKYYHIYQSICRGAKHRDKITGQYYENHHIIPRAFGGSNKSHNKVNLTGREHYIAHACLVKFLDGDRRNTMVYAFNMMHVISSDHKDRYYNSHLHEHNRKEWAKIHSTLMTGRVWVNYQGSEKHIKPTELITYLDNGWSLGRVPFTQQHKKAMQQPKTEEAKNNMKIARKKFIDNGGEPGIKNKKILHHKKKKLQKIVEINKTQSYLDAGWEIGVLFDTRKDVRHIQVFNENDEIMHDVETAFGNYCNQNNLPFTTFQWSYNTNKKIHTSKAKQKSPYRGWYAKIVAL